MAKTTIPGGVVHELPKDFGDRLTLNPEALATWGDITGAPGVCMSTRAPGAANMVNGVTHAWMDRSPLIAITDQYGPATYATGLRQRLDQLSLYDSVTKWNGTIQASTVRHTLRRAMREAYGVKGVRARNTYHGTYAEALERLHAREAALAARGVHPDQLELAG